MISPTSIFLGIGVEKAATSWIYACLYEHPELCLPIKEIDFFNDEVLYSKGLTWYKSIFQQRCENQKKFFGEFSTSYFYSKEAPQRIHQNLPDTKLIICLRDPINRAFSNYINDIKAGAIEKTTSFETAIKTQSYYLEQGKYKEQFQRYFQYFKEEQFLILIYEDIANDPLGFIQKIYSFLNVDHNFNPPTLTQKINVGRIPSNVGMDKLSNSIASKLSKSQIGEKFWWMVKKSRIPELVRKVNTNNEINSTILPETYNQFIPYFQDDKEFVENLTNRKLNWLIEKNI